MKLTLACLVSLLLVSSVSAQLTLRGSVTDENDQGISGATIKVDNSVNSATTDENGAFSIELSDGYETLIISAKGFQVQKIYDLAHSLAVLAF
ncbi:MAG: carboxypeptidase regulatory-like domain-containing protein [Ekhidna sp.]|nr:carboxypeptidase regulatory-like domain-containing protein [Ekhidna sp.]